MKTIKIIFLFVLIIGTIFCQEESNSVNQYNKRAGFLDNFDFDFRVMNIDTANETITLKFTAEIDTCVGNKLIYHPPVEDKLITHTMSIESEECNSGRVWKEYVFPTKGTKHELIGTFSLHQCEKRINVYSIQMREYDGMCSYPASQYGFMDGYTINVVYDFLDLYDEDYLIFGDDADIDEVFSRYDEYYKIQWRYSFGKITNEELVEYMDSVHHYSKEEKQFLLDYKQSSWIHTKEEEEEEIKLELYKNELKFKNKVRVP